MLIEEVRVGGISTPVNGSAELLLAPSPGPVEIRYTLPQLSAPEQMRFRYRLTGLGGDEWVSTGNQRTVTFTHLPPGEYRFEVAAAEGGGPWLPTTASLAFLVRAEWWETIWFRAGAGLLGALALAMLVRFVVKRRMRARMRRLEQEHALERERTRIARDMHDELGARLTRIALMSDLAAFEPEMAAGPAAERLGEIAQAARSVSGTLDEIVWTVSPSNDTLERLVGYIGEYVGTAGLNLRLRR